ncbi:sugar kinase [Pseudoalteromonas sp. L23]|uniref:sugar kinase n=1 Tax=unclassified Pseudoalteromonas TaxID=194690 RepID=UPI001EF0B3C2|nr:MULTISPECIES: sugar kinase [unclassified Pseudoalteromonas]MCF7515652.1 sugar kinase [Pseudoalteromonas sp. L7]MCF7527691.1 sugar kinase [Pseudoalteromonas sp. L23]MCX2767978.1 sugar kinase [Pseudoalteromonas sp. B530]
MKGAIKQLLCFGECMVEHRADGTSSFGGDTFNTAWYLTQLLKQSNDNHIAVSFASAIGTDKASTNLLDMLSNTNIRQDYISLEPHSALGEYWITLDEKGERRFTFAREHSPARHYFKRDETLTQALHNKLIDAIYLSGISLAIICESQRKHLFEALAAFKNRGGLIFFDNNYRQTLWRSDNPKLSYQAVMALADIAFLTDEDEYAVYGTANVDEIIAEHKKQSSQLLVIRQGAQPCVIAPADDSSPIYIAAQNIAPQLILDTCGAGDAFAAGFLAHWLKGCDLQTAACFAHQIAAEAIQHHGALISADFLPKLVTQE